MIKGYKLTNRLYWKRLSVKGLSAVLEHLLKKRESLKEKFQSLKEEKLEYETFMCDLGNQTVCFIYRDKLTKEDAPPVTNFRVRNASPGTVQSMHC